MQRHLKTSIIQIKFPQDLISKYTELVKQQCFNWYKFLKFIYLPSTIYKCTNEIIAK